MNVDLGSLVKKLNETSRAALAEAGALCLSRTHYNVEIEHLLLKLMDRVDGDLAAILKYFEIDRSRLSDELNRSLDRLKSGNARTPVFSPAILKMLTEAWTVGSINFGFNEIRSGAAILALVTEPELLHMIREFSRELTRINSETLRTHFRELTADSVEARQSAQAAGAVESEQARRPGGKSPYLDQYTTHLTENARLGKIDPVLARDAEIRQVIDILSRRRQNNPILVGEAGVGKTAVVEGFALRVVHGDVPPPLRNVSVRSLDLALLQAGAGVRGEFENRLKGLIEEVKKSETPIILFIDEAHTMIGAGGQAGQGDAANLLKPALARGELRTIAATTWSEYKKYFEKDAALARRFQPVKVEEPSETQCMVMLRGLSDMLEKHHNVRILDEGIAAAVRLSHRYIPDRQLPDKAVSVLDTACARVTLGQTGVPAAIEDAQRTLDYLAVQKRVLEREAAAGANHEERLREIEDRRRAEHELFTALQARWETERDLVRRIRELRKRLEDLSAASERAALHPELDNLSRQLQTVQGEQPLIGICVDAQVIGEVISGWTGIPVGKMLRDEIETILNLEKHLNARIIGQSHALRAISQRIRTARANLDDPGKPVGVFLLVGPSGVGKTESALALSDLLYGGERNLISINMSEFQEAHTVSTLKGSPPGYVGYGEGGVLTEAVRRKPYSVVLLDEVEKAHPDVLELFFQVFDKGVMEDGEGRQIDFKNTIIILTSNAGSATLMKLTADPETMPSPEALVKALKPELDKIFKPAFLGRLITVPYLPVRDDVLKDIVRLKLGKIQRRLGENHRVRFQYEETLVGEVFRRCTEVESGARNIDNILTNTLLPEISCMLLAEMTEGRQPALIRADIGEDGSFRYSMHQAEVQAAAG